ncbi:MAG: phosphonate metabolism protein PhnP [Candidatus Thiodiazotropha lotti]|uniref:Phosphonate metabolism protein PhnP n=1 Tax=Candidatus Thiodiazotropha endoloripes TaxID=1818881 RepID=A0A1E2UHJ2_9GAMM|nr:phosphonate metabolism protein PhnP [Candidatus Thiodiazotropha endoloripes]MCG7897242.1 phosphonate metabolism protein PhnP [Candidatus Thiodiazotropha weberae]MCG7993083.1 phosphonate metabolism protein PhnP [Candidatus Thiodiazotropha lotti]MCG8000217.1 phosphonate metabolism protein PhnP [Candidatus Thiodiazotropha lotti]MCW4184745.1 phosphonate metabolism protein PhnP [Candidatus Thiodiazotropha weberae]MCW4191987.1 phosphonate metabolism protein PhnP [Candidatus Thiodiazotropha webera
MRLKLLGSGNAAGMPLYGCRCEACDEATANHLLQRTPCSAQLDIGGRTYLLDAGQMNLTQRFPAGSLDGILLTHFHVDHVQGLFHLRWGVGEEIPVYCPEDDEGCADLYKHPGNLRFHHQQAFVPFMLNELRVTPLSLNHSKPTFGYLFTGHNVQIAYLTDTKGLPPTTTELLRRQQIDLMVIDCSLVPGCDRQGHNNLDDALDLHETIGSSHTVLTHIGHDLDIWLKANPQALPENILVGSDDQIVYPVD